MIFLKFVTGLLLSFLILSGCGSGSGSGDTISEETVDKTSGDNSGIVAGEVESSLTEVTPLEYEYKVKNQTKDTVTLEFTSSQRIDYSIATKTGKEIYLYSSTASFLAALGEEDILPGEDFTHKINLADLNLEKGEYTLTVWMTPKEGKQYEVHTEFSVD